MNCKVSKPVLRTPRFVKNSTKFCFTEKGDETIHGRTLLVVLSSFQVLDFPNSPVFKNATPPRRARRNNFVSYGLASLESVRRNVFRIWMLIFLPLAGSSVSFGCSCYP